MVQFTEKAEVSLPSDREVSVARAFRAPRDLVFEAFTRPELMRRWMLGPPGWEMTVCEIDLKVGGEYRLRWRSEADGAEFGFLGTYLEVDPPSRKAHTQHYDPGTVGGTMGEGNEARITQTFEEIDGRTRVTTLVDYGSREARDAALSTGMTDGMEMSYQSLDGLIHEGVLG